MERIGKDPLRQRQVCGECGVSRQVVRGLVELHLYYNGRGHACPGSLVPVWRAERVRQGRPRPPRVSRRACRRWLARFHYRCCADTHPHGLTPWPV